MSPLPTMLMLLVVLSMPVATVPMSAFSLCASSLLAVALLDLVVRCTVPVPGAQWFALHAITNACICLLSWPSLSAALADPVHILDSTAYPPCLVGPGSKLPLHVVNALHLHHALAYPMTSAEWVHHVVFVLTLGSTGAWFDWGLLSNYLAFFLCGLPGGVEYALLAVKRSGRCSDCLCRRASVWLNLALRAPAVLIGLGMGFVATSLGRYEVPLWSIVLHDVLAAINVCYYAFVSVRRSARL